jgi:hypothetical protein
MSYNIENSSPVLGGALYIQALLSVSLTLRDCLAEHFRENQGDPGGANRLRLIFHSLGLKIQLKDCIGTLLSNYRSPRI